MAALAHLFRGKKDPDNHFDPYQDDMGERLSVDALLSIREIEDTLIGLGHLSESDRYKVPEYLTEEWIEAVGEHEARRGEQTFTT